MAGRKIFNCAGPSYHLADKKAAIQSAINCYPQRLEGDRWMMRSAPGYVAKGSTPGIPWRGSKALDDRWFVVSGTVFYEVLAADGILVIRGILTTSTGFVGMAINASQVAIVDGPNLYIYNYLTQVFTQVASAGWRGSDDVHEVDGYFVFVDPETDQFYISAIDDGTSLDALDFSSADSSPDAIITHRVNHKQIWFFGKSNSTEIWINSGDPAFPFVRYQSYTLDIGCVGKRAAINAADTLFWVGKTDRGTGIVYMAEGNQPKRVSNLAVEEALRGSTDITQTKMWAYQIEGHEFIGIEAPGLETTWVFDAATQQWHERGEWDDGWQPLGINFVIYFSTTDAAWPNPRPGILWAGTEDGGLYELDEDTNNLDSRVLRRERTWPHFIAEDMEPRTYHSLELAMPSGSGGNVVLEVSNDGGASFGPPLLRSLGATGRRMQPLRWYDLGEAANRVFRTWCSDDVPWAIHSATVDAE